jgi:hypothetical protein
MQSVGRTLDIACVSVDVVCTNSTFLSVSEVMGSAGTCDFLGA